MRCACTMPIILGIQKGLMSQTENIVLSVYIITIKAVSGDLEYNVLLRVVDFQ